VTSGQAQTFSALRPPQIPGYAQYTKCKAREQLLNKCNEDRLKNRTAIKSLIRCTHTTNFGELSAGETLRTFFETAGKKAQYTSRIGRRIPVEETSLSTILFYHG